MPTKKTSGTWKQALTSAITLSPQRSRQEPKAIPIDAKPVNNHLNSAIAPSLVPTKVFDTAPEMRGLFENYFGFDIGNIANMSPQQIGELVDMINQARQFDEMLPIIKKHIQDYIGYKVNHDM